MTALEFRLFDIAEIYAGAMLWPAERAPEVMHAWREWTQVVPDDVTTSARVLQFPPLPDIPEPMRGRAFAVVDGAIAGEPHEARILIAPLRALRPQIDTFATIPVPGLQRIHMDPEEPVPARSDHTMLRTLPATGLDALLELADPAGGSPLLMVELRHLGGALRQAPQDAGALGSLDGEYAFLGLGISMGPEVAAAIEAHLALTRAALAPYESGSVYSSFAERPVDTATMYGADAYGRLREIKAAFDPDDLFRSNHPISPAA